MAESKRNTIDWQAELEEAINRNRLQLLNSNFVSDFNVNKTYKGIQDQLLLETNKLFNRANLRGKWILSDAIKFKRLDKLTQSINKTNLLLNRDLKKIFKKQLRMISEDEFNQTQKIMNDFQLVNNAGLFRASTSKFLTDILKQDIQGLTYLKRLNKITGIQASQVEEAIRTSIALGEGFSRTEARVKKIISIGNQSVKRLVETSVMSMSNQAHFNNYKRLGVKFWRWSATLDNRTCPICGVQDGRIFPISQTGLIPAHFRCRCSPVAVVKKWDDKGLPNIQKDAGKTRIARNPITGKNYKVNADTNWRDWIKDQPVNVQKDVLGVGKQELWVKGDIKLRQLAPQRRIVPLKILKDRIQ
jgi:SPP1 gp7 family putative phage head morphogenesis protein